MIDYKDDLAKIEENVPKVYAAGEAAGYATGYGDGEAAGYEAGEAAGEANASKGLNTGIADEGTDNVVTGHSDTVELSDGNAAEARFFQALIAAGIIPDGSTEFTGGWVRGNNSIHSGSGFTAGDFNINSGRGNYTNGKNAKAFGYEQFIDGQDSTGIGTMNIIRAFRAGFIAGCGNIMTPDGNKDNPTDTDVHTGFIVGGDSEIHADSGWIGGLMNKIFHENVYILGRKITSQYKDQLLLGFNPAVTDRTLFAVGDGTDATPHNLIVAYKDMTTRRATHMWINTVLKVEGNVESDKKVIAKQAPTDDNDCVRLKELKEFTGKTSSKKYTITFPQDSAIADTNFTFVADGETSVHGSRCAGRTYLGQTFMFSSSSTTGLRIEYRTSDGFIGTLFNGGMGLAGEIDIITDAADITITSVIRAI